MKSFIFTISLKFMKKSRILVLSFLLSLCCFSAGAQEFLSAEPSGNLISLGFRVGANSSIRTFSRDYFRQWNVDSWGTGVDAGFVLDLNIRDFFALQPGVFFESRSGNYAYAQDYFDYSGEKQEFTEMGRYRTYNMVIPVMFSFRFNLSPTVRWIAEAGPYAQFMLHSTDKNKIIVPNVQPDASTQVNPAIAHANSLDGGLKIGAGFSLKRTYSFYLHYMAGARKAWKAPHEGGRNKAWVFTLGYDF